MQPPVLLYILRVAATLLLTNAIIVLLKMKPRYLPGLGVDLRRPTENGLRKSRKVEVILGHNKGDKEGVFINNDGAAPAKPLDDRNALSPNRFHIEVGVGIARNAHHNGPRRALIDEAKTAIIGTEKRLFQLKLLQNGGVIQMNQMDFRANSSTP